MRGFEPGRRIWLLRLPVLACALGLLILGDVGDALAADTMKLRGDLPDLVETWRASAKASPEAAPATPWVDVLIDGEVDGPFLRARGILPGTILPGLVTARLPVSLLEVLAESPEVRVVHPARRLVPLLDQAAEETDAVSLWQGSPPDFPANGCTGQSVVIGVVDMDIDVEHPDLRTVSGTRIHSIWHQSAGNAPPAGFDYGTEYTAAQIDAGAYGFYADPDGHGTHMVGTAAGNGRATGNGFDPYRYVGIAPEAEIIFVKASTDGTFLDTRVIDAVSYVFQKADALGKDAVVLLAMGKHSGPHDGTDPLDVALDALTGPGRIIVAGTGNTAAEAIHAETTLAPEQEGFVTFNVPAHLFSTAERVDIEGWFAGGGSVTLLSPNGDTVGPVPRGEVEVVSGVDGYLLVDYRYEVGGTPKIRFRLTYYSGKTIAPGEWQIRFTPDAVSAGTADFWITNYFLTGKKPVFVQGETSAKLVMSPASANEVIGVGAYCAKSNWTSESGASTSYPLAVLHEIAEFSNPGPRRDGVVKPDIAASGYGVAAALPPTAGVLSSYVVEDGEHFMLKGTSVAAAVTAGAVVLLLEEQPGLDPTQVKAVLQARALQDSYTGVVPNPVWGFGKLSLTPQAQVGVADPPRPRIGDSLPVIRLGAAYPNPAVRSTSFPLDLDEAQIVNAGVYDVLGRPVRRLFEGALPAGSHRLDWDGRTDRGETAPAGRYYLRARAAGEERSTAVVLRR